MSRIARILLAVALLGLGLGMAVHAEGGVIQGQVTNGTAGEHPSLGGLGVQLYLFTGNTINEKRTTNTSATGVYRFEGLPTGGAWSALATVQYAGVEYTSQMLDLAANSELTGDVTVYETTASDSNLQVERSHVIIEAGKGQLEVTQQLIVANTGDQTYIGADEVIPNRRATARVPLPAGATDVSFDPQEMASAMVRTGQGFVDTRPVVPGRQDYLFSYVLPAGGDAGTLVVPQPYATGSLDLLIHAPGAEISAPALERLGTREASGVTYQYLAGRNLAKGSDLQVRFSGLQRGEAGRADKEQSTAPAAGSAQRSWWYGWGPLLLLPVLLVSVGLRWRRSAPEAGLGAREVGVAWRRQLLARVVDLDMRYEAGEIAESIYREKRAGAMAPLVNSLLGQPVEESEAAVGATSRQGARRADVRPRKEVRAHSRPAQRRPKAG